MMVEAESTPATWGLVRGGRTAPTEEVVATGLEAAKPFIKVLCDAQVALAAKLPKETYDFPVFKDYEDDVYAAVEEKAADELSRIEQIAAKLERQELSPSSRPASRPSSLRRSRNARLRFPERLRPS
ncbi:polyribonucleotide nucleotidyltransferase [Cutibacterium acnes JCM 18918]|nr:polyribonucleotide nucleotidyltransferase [Cutibacterium acnes JCM 18918]